MTTLKLCHSPWSCVIGFYELWCSDCSISISIKAPLDSLAWPGLWRRPLRVEELLMTVNNNYCWCIITEPLSCAEESKKIRRKLRSTLRMTMKRWWVTILIQNPALSDHQARRTLQTFQLQLSSSVLNMTILTFKFWIRSRKDPGRNWTGNAEINIPGLRDDWNVWYKDKSSRKFRRVIDVKINRSIASRHIGFTDRFGNLYSPWYENLTDMKMFENTIKWFCSI